MRPIKQQGDTCMLTSLAMLLDISVEDIIKELGHDGLSIWWPENRGCKRYRGINIQEAIDCVVRRRRGLMPIHLYPMNAPDVNSTPKSIYPEAVATARFLRLIDGRPGLLFVENHSGNRHCCAWDGELVYDPLGAIGEIEDLKMPIIECWVLI